MAHFLTLKDIKRCLKENKGFVKEGKGSPRNPQEKSMKTFGFPKEFNASYFPHTSLGSFMSRETSFDYIK